MRRIFRRMLPRGQKHFWYRTWSRPPHLTAAERHELRRR